MNGLRFTQGKLRPSVRRISLALCLLLWLGPLVAPTHAQLPDPIRRVNAPYFDAGVHFSEMAIFWFGQINSVDNHTDVRVGYNDEHLRVRIAVFDRYLWYDPTPADSPLDAWDAVTLYLDVNGDRGTAPAGDDHRFVAQLNWWEARDDFQAVYRGDGAGWVLDTVDFTANSGWRGNAPNDGIDDRGWLMDFTIPFDSLGLSSPPADGTRWGMAVTTHDRDNAAGSPAIADKHWPESAQGTGPGTWGELVFNPPRYEPAPATSEGTTVIRHKLEDATVPDAAVGGSTVCGSGTDFWTEWGDTNEGFYHPDRAIFNIQNQGDVADWPCFSRYYVTFPLNALPADKAIISATLTLHQFGNAGEPGQAQPSLIQVLTVAEDWDELTLTWNNAPLAVENVAAAWADPLLEFAGWPGVPLTWDVKGAVAEAYGAGTPLRLALYEADWAYHSGKYFSSSNTGDWNEVARPTLTVEWGAPESETAALDGNVTLQGRPPAPHPHWITDLSVSLTIPGEGSPRYTFTPTTTDEGSFSLSNIEPATYEIRVKNSHTLQNLRTVALAADTNDVDFGVLREGDANDDNFVTLLDFSILSAAFATCEGDIRYDERADFNVDGCITILDFSLLSTNFGQAGDADP